jgi:hypothetical protein
MTGDALIRALQALPAEDRKLPVVSYELGALLVELERPRISYRDHHQLETHADRKHERVIVL